MEEKPKTRPKATGRSASVLNREMVAQILEVKPKGNEQYSLKHLAELIEKRGDIQRVADLCGLYYEAFPAQKAVAIQQFYYWYKDTPVSDEDQRVYDVYTAYVYEKYKIDRVSPTTFSGRGRALLERIVEWSGDCGNSLDSLLIDFCSVVTAKASEFAPALLYTPKSLLEDFGWGAFQDSVRARGGRDAILKPSSAALKKAQMRNNKLDALREHRLMLLDKGDVKGFDRIGQALTEKSIDVVFKEILIDGK